MGNTTSVIIACGTYLLKGDSIVAGNSILSLKIDASTNQLLAKMNEIEKKIEDHSKRIATLEEKVETLHSLNIRNISAIDLLAKHTQITWDEKKIVDNWNNNLKGDWTAK